MLFELALGSGRSGKKGRACVNIYTDLSWFDSEPGRSGNEVTPQEKKNKGGFYLRRSGIGDVNEH